MAAEGDVTGEVGHAPDMSLSGVVFAPDTTHSKGGGDGDASMDWD